MPKDAAGNTGSATASVTVLDPTDVDAPVVAIAAPVEDAVITAPVNVVGTASDSTLTFYKLEVCPVSGACTEFARGTSSVVNDVLGRFDPSTLANDILRQAVRLKTGRYVAGHDFSEA